VSISRSVTASSLHSLIRHQTTVVSPTTWHALNIHSRLSPQSHHTITTHYHNHNHDRPIATNTLVRAVHSHQQPPQRPTPRRQDPPSTIRSREPLISLRQRSRPVQPPRPTSLRPLQLLHVLCISPGGISISRSATPATISFDISASKS
jgi:hypothetical protein